MKGSPPALARSVSGALGVAAFGLCAAAAAGAVTTAGARLAVPDLLAVGSATDALRYSVTLGVASLRVPVEAGGATGTVAPLTGAALALWALATGTRSRGAEWGGSRALRVAAVAGAASLLFALAAGLAATPGFSASPGWAAAAGLAWGAAGAWWGTRPANVAPPGSRLRFSPPATLAAVAAAGAAAWLLGAGVVRVAAGTPLPRLAGAFLLALAFAPNVLAMLVALGCGGRVHASLEGVLEGGLDGSVSLWGWFDGGIAPWYWLLLGVVPLAATVAAAVVNRDPWPQRGVRNGLVLAGLLLALGWAGAYEATETGGGGASATLGVEPVPAAVLGVAWGIAGAALAALGARVRRSRVEP